MGFKEIPHLASAAAEIAYERGFNMDVKHCDLCKKQIPSLDELYNVSYGKPSRGFLSGNNMKKGEICYDCYRKIDQFIQTLKK